MEHWESVRLLACANDRIQSGADPSYTTSSGWISSWVCSNPRPYANAEAGYWTLV